MGPMARGRRRRDIDRSVFYCMGVTSQVDAAELALRRGLASAAQGVPDSTVLFAVADAVPSEVVRSPYQISFVDAFLVDTSSFWRALTRSGFVWLVCYADGSIYEAEVRREDDGRWIGWLKPSSATECRGRLAR